MSTPQPTPPIRIRTLRPPEYPITIELGEDGTVTTLTVILRRPGRAGIARIANRMAIGLRNDGMGVIGERDGRGVEMDAVLAEYVHTLPDELAQIDGNGKQVTELGRPMLDAEKVPPDLYAALGEAAVRWHNSFRSVDARFGAVDGTSA